MAYRDLIVIGAGAAGCFGAIRYAELNPDHQVLILEKGKRALDKVRISGGGRCNVTHACFDPRELIQFYPRGSKELLGPFHHFMTGDMMAWLDEKDVELKIEDDGRIFPVSDDSMSIVNCFLKEIHDHRVEINFSCGISSLSRNKNRWVCRTVEGEFESDKILIAAGSSRQIWDLCKSLDIPIIEPVPSLFTFNIKDELIRDLMGISLPHAEVSIPQLKLSASGPLLITHWGLSGPAILRLSAWGARELADCSYRFRISVNLTGSDTEDVNQWIEKCRSQSGKLLALKTPYPGIPKRLWERICKIAGCSQRPWSELRKTEAEQMLHLLTKAQLPVNGKSTFKDEFVTAGGVDLKSIDFRTMESKLHPGLYFAGEVLNIDAITGGFNFQAAWTTSWIAASAM